jgi:hypothetical protein
LAGLVAGCSGIGTSMTRMGRMGKNRGYEMAVGEHTVQQAAIAVLTARGYEVSVKPDPESGAEGAGLIVIGERKTQYSGAAVQGSMADVPTQMNTRDLVDVYLSKKWQMDNDLAAPNTTLVDIVGGSYLSKAPSVDENETPLTDAQISLLRDDIERHATAIQADKAAAE